MGGMDDLVSIGQAAEKLGLATSALRYYDERGLVHPHERHNGRRVYGPAELRALAFVKIASQLDLPLETAGALLNGPNPRWRAAVRAQIDQLQHLIAQAQATASFLTHALDCPADQPVHHCPVLTSVLDQVVDGLPVDQLLAPYAGTEHP